MFGSGEISLHTEDLVFPLVVGCSRGTNLGFMPNWTFKILFTFEVICRLNNAHFCLFLCAMLCYHSYFTLLLLFISISIFFFSCVISHFCVVLCHKDFSCCFSLFLSQQCIFRSFFFLRNYWLFGHCHKNGVGQSTGWMAVTQYRSSISGLLLCTLYH